MTGTHPFRSKEATCREHRFHSVASLPKPSRTVLDDNASPYPSPPVVNAIKKLHFSNDLSVGIGTGCAVFDEPKQSKPGLMSRTESSTRNRCPTFGDLLDSCCRGSSSTANYYSSTTGHGVFHRFENGTNCLYLHVAQTQQKRKWRRERDSTPRYPLRYSGFQDQEGSEPFAKFSTLLLFSTLQDFRQSLTATEPPAELTLALAGL
jgi:hypothetical protein